MKLTGSDRLRESRAYKAGIAGFAIGLLFIMAAAVVATVSLYSHYRAESWMDRTHQVTQLVQSMLLQLQEADLWQRRYIIGADERDLASFGEASRKVILELERLGGLTAVERDEQERIGTIRPMVLAHLAALQEGIDQRRTRGFAAVAGEAWRDGAPATLDRIRGLLVDMEREEWRLLAERTEAAAAARHRLGAFTAAGSAVGVLIAALGAVNAWRSRRAVLATYAQLQESEERLRLLGDNLPDSMVYQYTYDLDGSRRFLYISSGVERINGVTVADVLRDPGCLHRQV
ncbi:MAG TPA: CHASE3 domain-containing protein, partial [Tepidisphaeraceae bacterium]|nr:CHASE3 domain-containing protein [Tepidisphaeraceae bacterium]